MAISLLKNLEASRNALLNNNDPTIARFQRERAALPPLSEVIRPRNEVPVNHTDRTDRLLGHGLLDCCEKLKKYIEEMEDTLTYWITLLLYPAM